MMRFSFSRWLGAAGLFGLPFGAAAQAAPVESCDCPAVFARSVALIETNHAGFADKVTPATRPRYDSLTAALRRRAASVSRADCPTLLRQWVRFFRDGHVQLAYTLGERGTPAQVRAWFADGERVSVGELAQLRAGRGATGPLRGEWRNESGSYRVRFQPTGADTWAGVITRADSVWWLPGQVKMRLERKSDDTYAGTLWLRDHSAEAVTPQFSADGQRLLIRGDWWTRVGDAASGPAPVATPAPAPFVPFRFTMLDDTTALYRIATFDGNFKSRIDSTTRANAANLARARLLIVDVRGNGGGSDASYASLQPYYATGLMQWVGNEIWATPENIRRYDEYASALRQLPAAEQRALLRQRRREEAHAGEWVPNGKAISTGRIKPAKPRPARVAVLQDRYCGSTTEQLLLEVKQSRIVTRFGEPSAGVLDYANMHFVPVCEFMDLGWATSRTLRIARGEGIDNTGLAPDVRLDPVAPDFVEQVRAWYRHPKQP